MKRGMTIEYLNCKADLKFEVDVGVNDAIVIRVLDRFHPKFKKKAS